MAFTAVELLEMVLHLWKCLFTVPNAGANGSQTMKKTKIIVVTMLVGFALHRLALCQSNATDASLTESNLLYGAMVSNVIKMSTAGETSTNAAASIVAETNSPATNTGSNEPASGAMTSNPASTSASPASTTGSNQPVSFTTSNASASGAMTSNSASTSASPTATAGSNQPVSFTSSNQTATSSATSNVAVVTSGSNATAAATGSNQPISFTSSNQTATSSATSNVTAGSNYITAGSSNTMASDNGSNATTEAGATNSQASAEASAPAAAAELPISFQDTPITAAIESLGAARGHQLFARPEDRLRPAGCERANQTRTHTVHPLGKCHRAAGALGAAGQLRFATGRKSKNRNIQDNHQGSQRAAGVDHARHPAQICQHFQHDGFRREHLD